MRARNRGHAAQLSASLTRFTNRRPLPGIANDERRTAFVEQLVESVRRVDFVKILRQRDISPQRADPSSALFDPVKAAIHHDLAGDRDEAFWLVFLSVHFGRNRRTGWRLARDVYGGAGGERWTWARISGHPDAFRQWLAANLATLHGADGVARHFGNHRKYESLDAWSNAGTGAVISSYVAWIAPPRTHDELFQAALAEAGGDPRLAFDALYRSMRPVRRFGRTGRFDYLTMVANLSLAPIEAGKTYMTGATGPMAGAQLLFGGAATRRASRARVDGWLVELAGALDVPMQVLEDALCNWQKSPARFKPFRG